MPGEIWYCMWACYGVYARHGTIVAATVDTTVGAIVCQNSRQPHCWLWVWPYIRGQQYNIRLCRRQKDRMEARHYRGQTCHSVGKLLHFPSWNVSWLNSWKSNPVYNTHPKLYSKILGKKCVLYPRFYGILCCANGHTPYICKVIVISAFWQFLPITLFPVWPVGMIK